MKILSVVFVAGGILLALYPLYTHLYSRIIQWSMLSSVAAQVNQTPSTLASSEAVTPAVTAPSPLETKVPGLTVAEPNAVLKATKEFTEAILEIPAIKLTTVVLKGTSQEVLAKAPGWYEESDPPGQGNTAIAGHLNTNGSWFRNIGKLKTGEEIILKYEGQAYYYEVEKVFPVQSTDWSVVDPLGYKALTLTTCVANDRSHRLIVRARQISAIPLTDINKITS